MALRVHRIITSTWIIGERDIVGENVASVTDAEGIVREICLIAPLRQMGCSNFLLRFRGPNL